MRLSEPEFKAMNHALRRFVQRTVEFPTFQSIGLKPNPGHLLEIGCGSGYGAALLQTLNPASYVGIDLMPEQITLAQKHRLPRCVFLQQDATDLSPFGAGTLHTIVIFGVLHHIPAWQQVILECYRVLALGGTLFVEEPGADLLVPWERIFHWDHTDPNLFTLKAFEACLQDSGFTITGRRYFLGFGSYAAKKQSTACGEI
jgi:SAM-dependent methyltransferase